MGLDMYLRKIDKNIGDVDISTALKVIEADVEGIIDDIEEYENKENLEEYIEQGDFNTVDFSVKDIDIYLENKNIKNKETLKLCDEHNDLVGVAITGVGYFRKHPDLHGYMENLYVERGGKDTFNCIPLLLSKEDVIDIIEQHKLYLDDEDHLFDETVGFFFGSSDREAFEHSLKTFEKILDSTNWGKETIYYDSWW